MKKFSTLSDLHHYFHTTNTCALKSESNPVFGDGNEKADIIFIGEAPGKKEDQTGIPFVGAAGKFLTTMLETITMERKDIYITNIVKYRPPNNRDPKPEEKEACKEWLESEIQFIKPKLIIFLGRHSLNHFFPEIVISKAHGKLIHQRLDNFPCEYFLPLYHPAAALYNGRLRTELLKDFKKIPNIIKKISQ